MQIHEITEGVLGNLMGNYAGMAQNAAAKLQQQGYGTSYQIADADKIWPQKLAALKKDPAVQSYINGLIDAWQAESKKSAVPEAVDLPKIAPAKAGGPTPAEQAKLQQQIQAATAAPVATPGQQFKDWAAAHLASRVPGTGERINMDAVHKLVGLGTQLDQALAKVAGASGTPAESVAVKNYLELAIAGVQAISQQSKSMRATGAKLSGKYAKSTGNAQADAVLKAAGFNLS